MAQAITFTSDFKLGHYMKGLVYLCSFFSIPKINLHLPVPPKPMFWSQVCNFPNPILSVLSIQIQIVATVIAGTAQLGVQAWMFTNIP